MNNENLSKVATDKEAKFGCNGGNKFWFGAKDPASQEEHVVDGDYKDLNK
jgi:hypothetical protein